MHPSLQHPSTPKPEATGTPDCLANLIEATYAAYLALPDIPPANDLDALFALPDIGLTATTAPGALTVTDGVALIDCRTICPTVCCPACKGTHAIKQGWTYTTLTHMPAGTHHVRLRVAKQRLKCTNCAIKYTEDITYARFPHTQVTFTAALYMLHLAVEELLSFQAIARHTGVGWNAVNMIVLGLGMNQLSHIDWDLSKVTAIGIDEHVCRHFHPAGNDTNTANSGGFERYATVITDLTGRDDDTPRPHRLLAVLHGRTSDCVAAWINAQHPGFSDQIRIVAMDGSAPYRKAVGDWLERAEVVLDPFHVVRYCQDAVDEQRRECDRKKFGGRARKGDDTCNSRRLLFTQAGLLTDAQAARLAAIFQVKGRVELEVVWGLNQRVMGAYSAEDPQVGKQQMQQVLDVLAGGVPAGSVGLEYLQGKLVKRTEEILRYFDVGGKSNGVTEAFNGRMETMRRVAQGIVNFDNYTRRALVLFGGLRGRVRVTKHRNYVPCPA
ncbi:ISL3 family transposase [Corynebacterium sp. 13CS0277]|uniref:ISL3 family transposase n=1 Tax=Corynebacterium sp. 13CS0277 TaxID=2071994 RepID=UPI001304D8C2|nr:ISL3 family transposase [Corynebacterium sp. 13CS0277]